MTGLARATKTQLRQFVRALSRENRELRREVVAISPRVVPFTVDRELAIGTTIMIPVPRRFRCRG